MDNKKIIETLVKIAQTQQRAIHKLAQALPPDSIPTSETSFTPGSSTSAPPADPAHLPKPVSPVKTEAKVILDSLPDATKQQLAVLEVHDGHVLVKWKAPVNSATFNSVTQTVQNLQGKNALPGKSYKVVEKT